jgi:CRISPR-associated exonuclease Cas4
MESIIDYFIELKKREMEEYRNRAENEIHVTELLECPLKRGFRQRYPFLVAPTLPPFMHGDLIHLGLQRVLEIYGKEKGIEVEIEKEVEKKFNVDGREVVLKGRCDAVLPDAVVEIKSALSDMSIPQTHHIEQLRIYMNIVEKKKGMLVYITPNRATEYFLDDPMGDEEIIERIRKSLNNEGTPRFHWECERCTFAWFCPQKKTREAV